MQVDKDRLIISLVASAGPAARRGKVPQSLAGEHERRGERGGLVRSSSPRNLSELHRPWRACCVGGCDLSLSSRV